MMFKSMGMGMDESPPARCEDRDRAHYFEDDRKAGIVIETIREAHGGPFSGQHARYVLRSLITILETKGGKS